MRGAGLISRLGLAGWLFWGCAARAATIVLPADPQPEERTAAEDLRQVWLAGSGELARVRIERAQPAPEESGPWFYLGETELALGRVEVTKSAGEDGWRIRTLSGDRVVIRGASAASTALGVDWFARQILGVRWFQPGELGEEVPRLEGWKPPVLDQWVTPAFRSREFSGLDTAGQIWARRNGLHRTLPHAHALSHVFPPELFAGHPIWFPLLNGERYRPSSTEDHNWQPNLALPEVAAHAAEVANARFEREPGEWGFSLSINDSIRFDQSEATRQARGPLRWFRGRPDYSDLVFGFMNRVADAVAPRHPDKLLSAYAYYWSENVPSFAVRADVVPWLTADRSQWYDPAFARADQALIGRWCRSGAALVGIYDYLYGAPFVVPRVTVELTARSIQFEYQAGARAFMGEANPHWAFDGAKLWVASQLLEDPSRSIAGLRDEYYRGFWGDAAGPMRRFDELCERAWIGQPGPGWWIKYYNDESQARLFPAGLRAELRGLIGRAGEQGGRPEVSRRVDARSAAFAVTERFAEFCEAREALADAAAASTWNRPRVLLLLGDYLKRRAAVEPALARAIAAGGMGPMDLWPYMRNDPEGRVAARLSGEKSEQEAGLRDPEWRTVTAPTMLDDRTFWWSRTPWIGRGEPVEGRTIEVRTSQDGRKRLRFAHDKAESFFQWVAARPGAAYRASANFQGMVGPGNETLLIVNWMDRNGRYVGRESTDQLPPGDWSKGRSLLIEAQAPAGAAYAGVGVFVYNQTGNDYAEFSDLRLKTAGSR